MRGVHASCVIFTPERWKIWPNYGAEVEFFGSEVAG